MRKILIMALLCGVSSTAMAFEWKNLWQRPDERGAKHLAHKRYKQAAEEFTSIPWRGVAYYRDADYLQAEQSFLQDKTPSGHFNRGNALALQTKYQEAIAAYDSALAIDPKMKKAHDAREIVMKLLEKQKQENQPKKDDQQKQQENKQQEQQQQGQNKSPDQSEQNKQQPSPEKNDKEKEQQSQQSDNGKQQDPDKGNTKDNTKQDKQNPQQGGNDQQHAKTEPGKDQPDQKSQNNQQRADQQDGKEAQPKPQQQSKSGEQKQQNSKVARDDQSKNADPDPVPQGQEKDKPAKAQPGKFDDQATQQWLQQVPDDPAGLLRRKFLRDHQQRLMEQGG